MSYTSVQFLGDQAVLEAFRNSDCCNWSVLQNKQFMFKYEGTEKSQAYAELDQLLKMISTSSGSEATYTLRTYDYEEVPTTKQTKDGKQIAVKVPKRKIYESTPFDGSFNFKIFDREQSPRSQASQDVYAMKKEFSEMKMMLQEVLQRQLEEEQQDKKTDTVGTAMGFVSSLLEQPEVKAAIAGKVVQLFNGITNKVGSIFDQRPLPAKIAGTDQATFPVQPEPAPLTEKPIELPAEQVQKLNYALTTLVKLDASFPDHLYKLCQIAERQPDTYKVLVSQLKNMQL
jgi:hypothetical protein